MRVLISSLSAVAKEREVEVGELNFEQDKGNFWIQCVMGDDWLQRVNSSARLEFPPKLVRYSANVAFVVFETECEAQQFEDWLFYAQEQVRKGFRTMRG